MRIATGALRPRNDGSRKNLRVIPRPVRRLVVGIRNTPAQRTRRTDCHTSDIGHWFAMTHYKKCGVSPDGRTEASAPTECNKRCSGQAAARVAPTEGLPIELRRGRRPRRPASVIRGTVPRAKNKIVPGFCQGRCAAPWYHLASRPAHAGSLMKCRYTSALLRARPSEPKAQEALDPAAPEPCSPVRPAPAFTYSGSLGRSANGVLFPSLPF